MKAAIYHGVHKVEIVDLPDYECGDDAVILKNIYSSICGTDVAVYNHGLGLGHKITIGGEFGHETICQVYAVGKNVTDFKVGDRAYPYPLLVTGDKSKAGTIGGFSEYIYCPCPKWEESLYHVDEGISDKAAALIEPFTVGCRAARRGLPEKRTKSSSIWRGNNRYSGCYILKAFWL